MKSWYEIKASAEEAEICIYDEIGAWGVSAQAFIGELKRLAGRQITLRINSPGGVVTDGVAIFNALRRHEGGVIVQIDGLAASMASYIALVGQPVRMAENAYLMIHNPNGGAMGSSTDLRKAADLIDKMKVTLLTAYTTKTGRSPEEVSAAMDDETWYTAAEAKDFGLIDEITDGVQIAAKFDLSKFKHAPRIDTRAASMANIKAEELPETPDEETPAETPELKACPFSGSTDLSEVDGVIVCNTNGVRGPIPADGETPGDAWNNRASDDEDSVDDPSEDPMTEPMAKVPVVKNITEARKALAVNAQALAKSQSSLRKLKAQIAEVSKSNVAALHAKTLAEGKVRSITAEVTKLRAYKEGETARVNAAAQRLLSASGQPEVSGDVVTNATGGGGKTLAKAEFDKLSPRARMNFYREGGRIA